MEVPHDDPAVATFTWTITRDRHERVAALLLRGRAKMVSRAYWLAPTLALLALVNAWVVVDGAEARGGRERLALYAAAVFGVLAFGLAMGRYTAWRLMRRSWRSIEPYAGETVTLELRESGVSHRGPMSTGSLTWAAIVDAKPIEGGLLIGLGGDSIVLTDEDLEEVDSRLSGSALVDWIVARVDESRPPA